MSEAVAAPLFDEVRIHAGFIRRDCGLTFVIQGDPVGKGRPKFVRLKNFVSTYTPKKTRTYEDIVRCHALEAWQGKPLLDHVPLQLDVQCFVGVPKSWSKKARAAALAGLTRPVGKPDWDNFGKLISDALNEVVYRDDSAIWKATVTKRYDEVPRTVVTLTWEGAV